MTARIPQRATRPPQIPHYNHIKKYIYVIYVIGIIDIGIAIFYLLSRVIPQWLMPVGFLLSGIAFLIMSAMLKKYPALSPSFLTKRSRHSNKNNPYNKKDNR